MKRKILFLLLLFITMQLLAAVGYGYISIYKTDGTVDSVAVEGVYSITHSKEGLDGKLHADYVTMVVTTKEGERKFLISEVAKVIMPPPAPMESISLFSGDPTSSTKAPRKIYFRGTFPPDDLTKKVPFKWEYRDSVYIHMAAQDTSYQTKLKEMNADSTYAYFETVKVKKKEEPIYIYYPGQNAPAYNKVKIARNQQQDKVDNSMHIGTSGDCATDIAVHKEGAADSIYTFDLHHHPAFFAFLAHNPRLPSVKLRSVTMIADKPISGTYTFSHEGGIDLTSVEADANDTITLKTSYFFDDNWLHTPRHIETAQDSTAAYMVVAPQEKVNFKFIYNVVDTLSLIDTTFVRTYYLEKLRPNTFYTVDAEIPDTLFSIVDLGLGDIKYAFRNVEAYFERGPVPNYGGAFAYGESNTKSNYDPGYRNDNYRGGSITEEFVDNYDAAYQRWRGCWRLMENAEADSLMKKCKTEWAEYNGVEGALVTGPSGKRIFLPANESCSTYWSIDKSKTIRDFYWIDSQGDYHYYKIPAIGIQEVGDSVVYHNYLQFYNPGYARGVLEYSNYVKSNTTFDGSLMLLRHVGESESSDGNFTINGIVRNARPWPSASTNVTLDETGFIFGTDSLTLYYNPAQDKEWEDSLFIKDPGPDPAFRPVEGKHLKLVDDYNKSVGPYESGQRSITVSLSGKNFLGYLDKQQKYYVREYFRIGDDYYYASKATPLKGFFPHTDSIQWKVGMTTATVNGYVVGVSSEVVGKVGFIISEVDDDGDEEIEAIEAKQEAVFKNPNLANGDLLLSDNDPIHLGEIRPDMTFSYTLPELKKDKYYFVRSVFVSFSEENGVKDTTCIYAPEVKVLHPLDTIDLGLCTKWANIDIEAQFPEDHDSTYVWNSDRQVNELITDISGTAHDVTFKKWFGDDGWTFAMPTANQLQALLDSCTFTPVTRFGEKVLRVEGPNSKRIYMPYYTSGNYSYSPYWTSNRPWKDQEQAYYGGYYNGQSGGRSAYNTRMITDKIWVRPVFQTNCSLTDGSPMFISTDTVGLNDDHSKVEMWGRVLGVTPKMKTEHSTITRGFVLHDYYGGTIKDTGPSKGANMPDENVEDGHYNGLYSVTMPNAVIDTLDSNKDYWYRAYIKVDDQIKYGIPKRLSPLTIKIKDIRWEVHENKAQLSSEIVGTIFIKDKANTTTGFIVGDSATIDMSSFETKWNYTFPEGSVISDGIYNVTMDVPVDTVYWVRAFITADGKTRYSEPRQFGLDYVDLGLPSKRLWANLSVGAGYPEDDIEFYSIGESFTKPHYHEKTYIDDTLKYVRINNVGDIYTTSQVKSEVLHCGNASGTKTYDLPYRGAVHETYHCEEPQYWKHYSGTRHDAAYVNWGNGNSKFTDETKYITRSKYGDLFVEPNYAEWKELADECAWTFVTENEVDGWRVTGPNGNTIFLPFKGHRGSTYNYSSKSSTLEWTDETRYETTAGYYHVADSVLSVSLTASSSLKSGFNSPGSTYSWPLGWSEFYEGLAVRPIARYNLPLTNNQEKLRDNTLVYLNTDTCTYLEYRTAVALQGTYRINYPIADADYDLGFIVGDRADITYNNSMIQTPVKLRDQSQYFTVLDADNGLLGDKTYYYRFYLHTGGIYYYADADTFHLAKHLTNNVNWTMYGTTATINGTVQGVMPADNLSNFKAGLIVGYDRNLTWDNKETDYNCTSQLNEKKVGPITATHTLPGDNTYYFRTYVYYNGKYHYGDVNLFGYELIDFELPSGKKWASINVGGNSPLNGLATSALGQSHGVYASNSNYPNQPYRNPGTGSATDYAHTKWHNVNRMPYQDEMQELINNTTWTADTIFGCPGVLVTGKNGKTMFFRHSIQYFQHEDDADYSLCGRSSSGYYLDIPKNNDADPAKHKGAVNSWGNHNPGCRGINFLRPIWESNIKLANDDELLIRTDDAIIHDQVDNVTFFGSLLGVVQQHFGGSSYTVPNIRHAGFVVGSDTLTTHTNQYFKYDFPKNNVTTDTIYYYDTQNINMFKVDSVYWVRAYVQIGDDYYYGSSIKFIREPNIKTGDVEWAVGKRKATLHGSVTGFNNNFNFASEDSSDEIKSMEELSENARVGIILGYKDGITHDSPASEIVKSYDLGKAVNGSFSIEVPYEKDTTYYYRAFIYYNEHYVYGKWTNHYGLEFVDLGLPMQWASISVGSRFAEDNCEQFAWGDTIDIKKAYGKNFTFDNYSYYYATGDDEYNNLGNEIKGSQHDVAHIRWNYTWDEEEYGGRGALWAMPSEEDLQMLVDQCLWTDSTSHGLDGSPLEGYRVTGPNGNSIFINKVRCDEYTMNGAHYYWGPWEYGPLWTSSRAPRDRNALGMETGTDNKLLKYHYRYHGHYVRPMAYINATLPGGKKLSITTERTSWVAGATEATIYGCILGLNESTTGSYGFIVGSSSENLVNGASGTTTYVIRENTNQVGLFSKTLKSLDNNRMYYFRSFFEKNGTYYYGDIKDFGIVMVDLGLTSGTKWANVNMGAWKEKDHGDFYAWGETTTKDVFTQEGYKYYNSLTNVYRNLGTNISGNDTTDVANKLLGGLWRMAGDEEWQELISECSWTPDTISHIPGFRVKSKKPGNNNSIFLPSNYYDLTERDANFDLITNEDGYREAINHDDEVTHRGYYWSSNRSTSHKQAREVLFIDSISGLSVLPRIQDNLRWRGNGIRPVARAHTGQDFYLRTEDTDWRYQKDSVNFYSVVLNLPENYETGFLIGTSATMTASVAGVTNIKAKPSIAGGGDYVAVVEHNDRNDGIYYYRAYVTNGSQYWYADAKQFGLEQVDLGIEGLQWANVNVDAASPEDIGLHGVLIGKYAGADPSYVEFGGVWRTPTDVEKQLLLDECNWTQNDNEGHPITLYGTQVWKVSNKTDASKFIYLTSNDPAEWGYRAVAQFNLTFNDGNKIYLRTDSTDWHAGYDNSNFYATLVGGTDILNNVTERGFVLGQTETVTHATATNNMIYTADDKQITTSAYTATMDELPLGTYYYRAFVKYKDEYYYADNAKAVGIEFIDLGLPSGVKWANLNIGSTIAADTGDLYAWGDTIVRSTYTTANYPYYTTVGYTDIGSDISSSEKYDVSTVKLHETRMPSQAEMQELIANCSWEATTQDEISGYRVTSNVNGNSIFLPAGDYWLSTQYTTDNSRAYILYNKSMSTAYRYLGKMVRPVTSLITTGDTLNVTMTQATLQGIVNVGTYGENVTVGFELSRSSVMNEAEQIVVDVTDDGKYHKDISELEESSLYYYRAFVKIDETTHYGTIKNFSTKSKETLALTPIDLGLSVKWADRNVGANLPEVYGTYYAWGDTLTRLNYTTVTYTHNVNNQYQNIGLDISASNWDIATKQYAGCWRMPTQAETQELLTRCQWTWTTKEGVPGYWVENILTHETIFLPAAGYRDMTNGRQLETNGHYWTATTNNATNANAMSLSFSSTTKSNATFTRYMGLTIRPVYQSNFTWGSGDDKRDIFIRTDSIVYATNREKNTLYGTMLGLNSAADQLKQGFVIGTSADVTTATTVIPDLEQDAAANGSYNIALNDNQLRTLTVGEVYWVRAYVTDGTNTSYGSALELTDYTFFTDSVQWGLGNEAKFYGHIKGVKPVSGLEIGFIYSTNKDMSNSKSVTATFGTGDAADVFTALMDTVKVATYYYQAYTKYEGEVHKSTIKNFGAKVVDLGLTSGVKWIDMNLGADEERQVGDAYRWGETVPMQTGTYNVTAESAIGGTIYDAAHARLGTKYRIPSASNIQELLDECDWAWDVTGYRITSRKNGNSIFLPVGSYWSSQQGEGTSTQATSLKIDTTNRTPDALEARTEALLLRPTLNPSADVSGDGGNAGGGTIGGGIEGNE